MKQVQNKGISLKGIERNTNEINVQDGACDELINLRIKDGALRPVGEKHRELKDFLAFSGYENFTNIFRHSILPDGSFVALFSDSNGQSIVLTDTSFGINPDTFDIDGTTQTTEFNITTTIDGAFTITTDSPSWITLSKASGTGNDVVTVTVDPSDTDDRVGTITFDDGTHQYTCTVNQESVSIAADEISVSTDYTAKSYVPVPLVVYPAGATFTSEELTPSNAIAITDDPENSQILFSVAENRTEGDLVYVIRVTLDLYPTYYIDITITQNPEFIP